MKSYRCSSDICEFVTKELGIKIESFDGNDTKSIIKFVEKDDEINSIYNDNSIIKLHFNNSIKYGVGHKNWGEVKGMDDFVDVCIALNKETYKNRNNFSLLNPLTKNKLYVAITRARRNIFFVEEEKIKKYIK